MKERSLIAFTLLAQLAAGVFITLLACSLWFLSFASLEEVFRWTGQGFRLAGGVMIVALLASFFHLGNPRNAWRAATNFRCSWLSREILFALTFTGITVVYAGTIGFGLPVRGLLYLLGAAGVVAGLGLVYSMARVYAQRTVPVWNSRYTVLEFILTALSLGAAATSLILAENEANPAARLITIERALAGWLGLGLLIQTVALFFWLNPAKKTDAYQEAVDLAAGKYRPILIVRIFFSCAAILASGILIGAWFEIDSELFSAVLWMMALLVMTAEIFGRDLFYRARVRQGV